MYLQADFTGFATLIAYANCTFTFFVANPQLRYSSQHSLRHKQHCDRPRVIFFREGTTAKVSLSIFRHTYQQSAYVRTTITLWTTDDKATGWIANDRLLQPVHHLLSTITSIPHASLNLYESYLKKHYPNAV